MCPQASETPAERMRILDRILAELRKALKSVLLAIMPSQHMPVEYSTCK